MSQEILGPIADAAEAADTFEVKREAPVPVRAVADAP